MLSSEALDVRGVVFKTAEAFLHIPVRDERIELGPLHFQSIMEGAAAKLRISRDIVKNGLRGGSLGNIIEILEVILHGHV